MDPMDLAYYEHHNFDKCLRISAQIGAGSFLLLAVLHRSWPACFGYPLLVGPSSAILIAQFYPVPLRRLGPLLHTSLSWTFSATMILSIVVTILDINT